MARKFFSGLFGKKQNDDVEPVVPEDTSTHQPQNEGTQQENIEATRVHPKNPQSENSEATNRQDTGENTEQFIEKDLPTVQVDEQEDEVRLSEDLRDDNESRVRKPSFFSKLKAGLSKTSNRLTDGVTSIFTKKKLDDEMLEELENLLITADLGVDAATRFTTNLAKSKFDKEVSEDEVKIALAEDVAMTLKKVERPLAIDISNKPHVILMTGVNGAGKTTTIGKLAAKFKEDGLSIMLAAGDTFRAAAIEQLAVWGERTNTPVIKRDVGADAAGLAFDAMKEAQAQNIDVLMIDTAGRLQNRSELMDELAKIIRVIKKIDENAPHDTVLVLDATVGQNAISQLEVFKEIAGVSGLIMTKLDGTARGGVLVALSDKFSVPVHYVGVGESIDDLQAFNADSFSKALAGIE